MFKDIISKKAISKKYKSLKKYVYWQKYLVNNKSLMP